MRKLILLIALVGFMSSCTVMTPHQKVKRSHKAVYTKERKSIHRVTTTEKLCFAGLVVLVILLNRPR